MTSVTVTTKIENIQDTNGNVCQKIVKRFPVDSLPFKVKSEIEGDFYLDKDKIVLPSWANFSENDYMYTVELNSKFVCIKATTPGLVNLASFEVFKNYMEDGVYLTKKDLGERFTFQKRDGDRKSNKDTNDDMMPINIFTNEDDY